MKIPVKTDTALLKAAVRAFLSDYGRPHIVGEEFYSKLCKKEDPLESLACEAGFFNTDDFVIELARLLEKGLTDGSPKLGRIGIPLVFLSEIISILEPEEAIYTIRNIEELERVSGIRICEKEKGSVQRVMDLYPVRLSAHVLRHMRFSQKVSGQYLPHVLELDPEGAEETWAGHFSEGVVERIYKNRVIFLVNGTCPVYCRFCFRKHRSLKKTGMTKTAKIKEAVEYVRMHPEITEVLLTGGDPLLSMKRLDAAISGLARLPNLRIIRIGTRSISYYPYLFLRDGEKVLRYLLDWQNSLKRMRKRLEIGTHFIHPDEVSIKSLDLISKLVEGGVPVYVQAPLLRGFNDRGEDLARLLSLLRNAGAEAHYLFLPCHPIRGNDRYDLPLSAGRSVAGYLRRNLSDRMIPRICTATPIGKIEWGLNGWAVKDDRERPGHVWIRTPFDFTYFESFSHDLKSPYEVRENPEGGYNISYPIDADLPDLFRGAKPPLSCKEPEFDRKRYEAARNELLNRPVKSMEIDPGGEPIFFIGEKRAVALIPACLEEIGILKDEKNITDIIIASDHEPINRVQNLCAVLESLKSIPHIRAARIRSLALSQDPGIFTREISQRIGRLVSFNIKNPFIVEIESVFLLPHEVTRHVNEAVALLNDHRIRVYADVPLISRVNDSPGLIDLLAERLRKTGIGFHRLYAAGLPVQELMNARDPVDISNLIKTASVLRRNQSGRAIPHYLIRTRTGDLDLGIGSAVVNEKGSIKVRPGGHESLNLRVTGLSDRNGLLSGHF